jgi:uncharacterized protein YcbX
MEAVVTALNVYPVKSCRGIALAAARIGAAGFDHDRRWLVVTPDGRFVTQRDRPRLALVATALDADRRVLSFPDGARITVPHAVDAPRLDVVVWGDRCAGRDCGDAVAARLSAVLDHDVRLVEFDEAVPRHADAAWAGGVAAPVRFPDSFPILLVSEESLADLNARLPAPLPMDRFRPNVVVRGLGAYGEDRVRELACGVLRLRPVKASTRCVVTTTDQATGVRIGDEPLRTLKSYRWDAALRGVTFGQNVVVAEGAGATLAVGDAFVAT